MPSKPLPGVSFLDFTQNPRRGCSQNILRITFENHSDLISGASLTITSSSALNDLNEIEFK